jgi:hypothetical protein
VLLKDLVHQATTAQQDQKYLNLIVLSANLATDAPQVPLLKSHALLALTNPLSSKNPASPVLKVISVQLILLRTLTKYAQQGTIALKVQHLPLNSLVQLEATIP